jgi:predicted 3-demethylubiquinone-9 3-methyltransferase (glyoxalase superfamily)
MKPGAQKITLFLWFDDQAEEAVSFYASIFKNSGIVGMARYGEVGAEASGRRMASDMGLPNLPCRSSSTS